LYIYIEREKEERESKRKRERGLLRRNDDEVESSIVSFQVKENIGEH
jgi:hypothetical protein